MEKNEETLQVPEGLKYGKEATELWNYVTNASIDLFNGDIDQETTYKRAVYFQEKIGRLVEKEVAIALAALQTETGTDDEESEV